MRHDEGGGETGMSYDEEGVRRGGMWYDEGGEEGRDVV